MELKINETYTIKLNSGEELITKIIEINDKWVSISEPVSIAPAQGGMQMIPSVFTADPKDSFQLNTNSIAIIAMTDDGLKMKYLEATTGLRVPDKKIITG